MARYKNTKKGLQMLQAFSIMDIKARLFNTPFFETSSVPAIRNVIRAHEDKNSNLNKFPDEFALYLLGNFNEDTGEMVPFEPLNLGTIFEITSHKQI